MKTYLPDKKALFTLRVILALLAVVLTLIVKAYIPVDILVVIFGTAIATAAIFFIFIYLPLYFSSLRYESTPEEVTRHSGVFMKSHQTVQFSAVQYTTVVKTHLSRYTGMNFIVFFVYGGQLQLLFLRSSDMDEILGRVEKRRKL